jgi:hypothetical protein
VREPVHLDLDAGSHSSLQLIGLLRLSYAANRRRGGTF